MGDGEHGAGVVLEELLEPQHALRVEVVGRLVEQQQVGRLEQQLAQRDAPALATRQHADRHVGVGALQRVHGLGELRVEVPSVGGVDLVLQAAHLVHQRVEVGVGGGHLLADLVEALDLGDDVAERLLDVLQDGLVLVERRLLLQDAHRVAGGEARLAVGDLLEAGHEAQQRRLAHAVGAHDADLGAGEKGKRHVVEDDLVAVRLARLVHLVDEFCHTLQPHWWLGCSAARADCRARRRVGCRHCRMDGPPAGNVHTNAASAGRRSLPGRRPAPPEPAPSTAAPRRSRRPAPTRHAPPAGPRVSCPGRGACRAA